MGKCYISNEECEYYDDEGDECIAVFVNQCPINIKRGKMKKTICFDFDGVIASYDGWKGFDVLGEPNQTVITVMKKLKTIGYHIIIFTTRPATPTLIDWLAKNDVPYDDINRNSRNPIMTSSKPIYHAFIDDRAINYHGQDELGLLADIDNIISKGGE